MEDDEVEAHQSQPLTSSPFLTVILPIRNEAGYIGRCLEALAEQTYPPERMEVLVVDGMSTDDTRSIVEGFAGRFAHLRLLDNPGKIVPTALNLALREARGEIVVRVDGHCVVAPDYLEQCARLLHETGAGGVGGPIETVGETPLAQAIAVGMSSPFGVGGSAFRTMRAGGTRQWVDTIAFPAYPREALERAGPFDEELVRNQDDEYNYRLRKLGGRLLLAGEVRAQYFSRSGLRALWRQYFQYGFWKVRVLQKHPRQMRPRQFAPILLVLGLLGSLLAAGGGVGGQVAWALPLLAWGGYLVLNLAASVLTAGQRGWRYLPWLPVVFATLHLAYGLGFLAGLVRFWNRWGRKNE